jgi:alkylation response protein AidB-like acyl-CoA dehydrogenase
MTVERQFVSDVGPDLLALVRDIAADTLAPQAADYEQRHEFPEPVYRTLGRAGLLSLPFPEEYGGGGLPYADYLQILEEIAASWLAVGIGVSVHALSCFPVVFYASDEQRKRFLPDLLGGELLGAYCLSEPHSGSDAAALTTKAARDGDQYVVDGTKAWITHGGVADFYELMVRTGEPGPRGISCLLADASTPGLSAAAPENKMGAWSSPTAQIRLESARVDADRLIGAEGQGFSIALAALDAGRLGIAACAVGLAQAALDAAVAYAGEREQFGRPIGDFQGMQFLLADAATGIEAARALYLSAATRRDAGMPFSAQAAMAKLFATDMAMRVTTDAVQVFGGYGYVTDFPVERYFREAKVLQIVEGTNQIQRMVIGRHLMKDG